MLNEGANSAMADVAKNVGLSALGGMLSGGVMGAGYQMVGNINGNNQVSVLEPTESTVEQPTKQTMQDLMRLEKPQTQNIDVSDKQITETEGFNEADTDAYKEARKQSIIQQIKDIFTGKTPNDARVEVGLTPSILQRYGAPGLNMNMSQSTLFKIAYPEGYGGGKHNLGFDAIAQLPYQLADPVAILKSDTQENSFVVVTEFVDENNYPIITAIHLDKKGVIEPANEIASMYGKRSITEWMKGQKSKGNVLYENKNKGVDSVALAGLQLPSLYSESDPLFNNSIPDLQNSVNKAEYSTKKIDGFPDLNKNLDKLVGMYKGNENTDAMFSEMKASINEYLQTYDQDAINRALILASDIDDSLVGHSYTRKGNGKNSVKSQNRRVTTTYENGSFVDELMSYQRELRDTARDTANANNSNFSNPGPLNPFESQNKIAEEVTANSDNTQTELPFQMAENTDLNTTTNSPVAEAEYNVRENNTTKTSQVATNTFQNSKLFKDVEANQAILQEEIKNKKLNVDVKSEMQSLKEAAQRLDADFEGEENRLNSDEAYSGVETDERVRLRCKYTQSIQKC